MTLCITNIFSNALTVSQESNILIIQNRHRLEGHIWVWPFFNKRRPVLSVKLQIKSNGFLLGRLFIYIEEYSRALPLECRQLLRQYARDEG